MLSAVLLSKQSQSQLYGDEITLDSIVSLVDQTRDNMRVLKIIVVEGAKDIRGDDAGEMAAIFQIVGSTG